MTTTLNLPALKPAEFRWHQSPTNSHTTQRLAIGTEQWVGIKHENAKGQYDNYLNTTLRLEESGISLARLSSQIAASLIHLRFTHPEVAATAIWEEGKPTPPLIQYTPPVDYAAASVWAQNCISVRASPLDGLVVRAELEREKRAAAPESARSVSVYIIANAASKEAPLALGTKIDVLCRFNHIYWDAMSSRQFVGDLLRLFGEVWVQGEDSEISASQYKWGDEVANLAEPILDALKVDVEALGDDFKKTQEEFIMSLINTGSSWGLIVTNSIGTPRTEFHTFSKVQSEAMIRGVKHRVGPQYTISHLGHAAMVLALLKARPLPDSAPDDTQLITPLPVNGRRFLRDEFVNKQYGCCQAGAVVEFPNLESWVVDDRDTDAVNAMLERGCRHVKAGYDYWLSKEFQVAVNVAKDIFLAANLSGAPPSFKDSSIPVLASDGLVDRYVPGEVTSPSGEKLLTVENCIFLLDTYLSGLLIRMDSFKGSTTMSITFNDGYISTENATAFLRHMTDYMLVFAK